MAVEGTQDLPTPLPGPLLSQKLLAGIDSKATVSLLGGDPDIAAGPDLAHGPGGTKKKGATFLRGCSLGHTPSNGQHLPTKKDFNWPVLHNACKLGLSFDVSLSGDERRHYRNS